MMKYKLSYGSSITDSIQCCEELSKLKTKFEDKSHSKCLTLAITSIRNIIQEFYVCDEGELQNTDNDTPNIRERMITKIVDALVTSLFLSLIFTGVTRKEREMINCTVRLTHLLVRDLMIFENITREDVSAGLQQRMSTQPEEDQSCWWNYCVVGDRVTLRDYEDIMNQVSRWDLHDGKCNPIQGICQR